MADPKGATEIFKKRVPEIESRHCTNTRVSGVDPMKTERYAKTASAGSTRRRCVILVDLVNTYMGLPSKERSSARTSTRLLTKVEMPKRSDRSVNTELIGLDRVGTTCQARSRPSPACPASARASSSPWRAPLSAAAASPPASGRPPARHRGRGEGRRHHRAGAHRRHRHGLSGAGAFLKWRSILQNVAPPAELAGKDAGALKARAEQLLDMAGPERLRRQAAARTVGRHAAACRALPRAAARSAAPADGLAVRLPPLHGATTWRSSFCASGERDLAREVRKTRCLSPRRCSCPIAWWSCRPAPAAASSADAPPAAAPDGGTAVFRGVWRLNLADFWRDLRASLASP